MEVFFEVAGELYALEEKPATTLAENLRLKAVGKLGTEGVEGARAMADLIEDVLVDRQHGPIQLEGEAAEAVFYSVKVPIVGLRQPTRQYALYAALRPLHEQRLRRKRGGR